MALDVEMPGLAERTQTASCEREPRSLRQNEPKLSLIDENGGSPDLRFKWTASRLCKRMFVIATASTTCLAERTQILNLAGGTRLAARRENLCCSTIGLSSGINLG
jgi:hypothetical protein